MGLVKSRSIFRKEANVLALGYSRKKKTGRIEDMEFPVVSKK